MSRKFFFNILFLCVCCMSISAYALIDTGDSSIGSLETISPTLQSISLVTGQSVSASFSEPMLTPGITAAGNYVVSGAGAGTLSASPDLVGGTDPYILTWNSGEMMDTAVLTVTANGVQDLAGNPINPAFNSGTCVGVGVAPVFSDLVVTPGTVMAEDKITLTFTASEPLDGDPDVAINGQLATYVSSAKSVSFVYEYTIEHTDAVGAATVSIQGIDLAGNPGSLVNNAAFEIIEYDPGVPVYAWPVALALMMAGLLVLAWRKHRESVILLIAIAVSLPAAWAESPTISEITFSQGPNGSGSTVVDISYKLTSPNGPCDISAALSKDGGLDGFPFPITSISGDINDVNGGPDFLHILWNVRADYPEEIIDQAQIRLTADDGLIQHTVTYTAGDHGSIVGTSPQTVNDGASASSVTAEPALGYHFVKWSDDVLTATRTDTNVIADIDVTATFAINQYTLTYLADVNGSIVGDSPQTVDYGNSGSSVTAQADIGYHFLKWSDDLLTATRTDSNVTADLTVTATFELTIPPVLNTFVINNDDATTGSSTVVLNNAAINLPAEFLASESAAFTGAVWAPYSVAPAFTLTSGVGPRTVYFKVRNFSGESDVLSDTIFLTPTMVSIAPGSFDMGRTSAGDDASGAADEIPVHTVSLSAYQVGKFDITNRQYADVLNWALAQGYLKTSGGANWAGTGNIYAGTNLQLILSFTSATCNIQYSGGIFSAKNRNGLPTGTSYSTNNHPVVHVTWYGAAAFCNWLSQMQGLTPCYDMTTATWPLTIVPPAIGGYRLPTEAEWERAAAWDGAKHWIYGFTSDVLSGSARCNYNSANPLGLTTQPYTSPAGWFNGTNISPNGLVQTQDSVSPSGCYDMSGNVSQWVQDWYLSTYYTTGGPPWNNPIGPAALTNRVFRGGWFINTAVNCRTAVRFSNTPVSQNQLLGFRVAQSQ